jgi:short-subunit dehydrogenase
LGSQKNHSLSGFFVLAKQFKRLPAKMFSPTVTFAVQFMEMAFFQDKVVVITGGTDGIGRALVDRLLQEGAKVATCGRNQDKLYALQMEYSGHSLHTMVADVSRYEDCDRFVSSTIETFGTIDILINNAGISMRAEVKEMDVQVIEKLMEINFLGAVYCTKLALPEIIRNKGTIVGISSIAGYRGLPGRSGYSASKFALQGFLESLRTEMMDDGVNVMWISPGFTASNIRFTALNREGMQQGESPMDEGSMMSAAECAGHILHAVEKRRRTLILTFTGKRAVFMNRFFPALADKLVHKFYYRGGKLIR